MPDIHAARPIRAGLRVKTDGRFAAARHRRCLSRPRASTWSTARMAGALLYLSVAAGCSTPSLRTARHHYYDGRPDLAEQQLDQVQVADKDRVLYLMERGMIRQSLGQYEESAQDFIKAAELLDELETYSLSKGGASMVVNDTVQDFLGAPYERALLHAYAAHSHMALGHWNDAAVEARRLIAILDPETRGDYPDDAYCRYVAGFYLSTADDIANTEFQYRKAADELSGVILDPATGHVKPAFSITATNTASSLDRGHTDSTHEFVCFISMGRSEGQWGAAQPMGYVEPVGFAEFYHEGQYMGRSYPFSDTAVLAASTEEVEAAWRAAKSAGRIVIKENIAVAVESSTDEVWGALARLVLIGLLERPDARRWETLPRSLQVARFPCPEGLTEYEVRFKGPEGQTMQTMHVSEPLQRYRNTYVSFCRDLPDKSQPGPLTPSGSIDDNVDIEGTGEAAVPPRN